ncbi:16S rRNA (guanine(966)-N(2))-methyltransferase RsmD [Methylohalobius crimeensis]|uniref:16S rRNA (guanine(966)-N(2))-methyltransferase RsmD n=1 Tax=Methylohalobius crimeensis TaxID=244365 RepID=UPI0003B32157|nr:16S rRNA (guanine(966)-N(2))-methyltransferase RsmD [Methylohalobius crimeensis]
MARKNEIRVIAGRWRGRKLVFPPVAGLRPTPGLVRETLFNWLRAEVSGARCLDLFAGSGALGFEAASRGAATVVQVESNLRVLKMLMDNRRKLGAEQIETVRGDVKRFLQRTPDRTFNLVFLDPPFGRGLVGACCRLLEAGGWLTPDAKIYVEAESELDCPPVPANWERLRHKRVGEAGCHLYQRQAT